MLEMKLDEAGLASTRFLLIETPLCDRDQNTVERTGTRLDAGSGKFLTEHTSSSLDQAIEEIAATSRLPEEHARTALLESTALFTVLLFSVLLLAALLAAAPNHTPMLRSPGLST